MTPARSLGIRADALVPIRHNKEKLWKRTVFHFLLLFLG